MRYQPYWMVAFSRHLQGIVYTVYSKILEKTPRYQEKYTREVFTLSDGGLVAIEWHHDWKDLKKS